MTAIDKLLKEGVYDSVSDMDIKVIESVMLSFSHEVLVATESQPLSSRETMVKSSLNSMVNAVNRNSIFIMEYFASPYCKDDGGGCVNIMGKSGYLDQYKTVIERPILRISPYAEYIEDCDSTIDHIKERSILYDMKMVDKDTMMHSLVRCNDMVDLILM